MNDILWAVFLPLILAVALIDSLTMGEKRRVVLYRRRGFSRRAIAQKMGISRYKVAKLLAS